MGTPIGIIPDPPHLRDKRAPHKVCANCAFWQEIVGGAGRCRKRAPLGLPYPVSKRHHDGVVLEWGIETRWPATNAAEFCGEFQSKAQS